MINVSSPPEVRNSRFITLSVRLQHHPWKERDANFPKVDDPTGKNLGTPKASSFQDCAEKCANYQGDEKCVRFMWKTDGKDRACYMRSSGGNLTPTTSSLFSSGQIV